MKILIVKLSAIGDVIHTLPLLTALRWLYPAAEIAWAVEEAAADLLAGHPDLDRVLISRRKSWIKSLRRGRSAAPLAEFKAFWQELRRHPYDLVIDAHGLLKSALIVAASGGRRKLGYASLQEGSGLFYNEKIPEDLTKHAVDRYLDFARHLSGERGGSGDGGAVHLDAPEFRIAIGAGEERRVAALLDEQAAVGEAGKTGGSKAGAAGQPAGQAENPPPEAPKGIFMEGGGRGSPPDTGASTGKYRPFVAVNPVAFWETKLWDDAKFAALCDRIRTELGLGVILTGGEAGPLERIRAEMKTPAMNLGGQTSLRELACLYRRAALVVSTDSGPMHLAAAVGTPVVALFGPTDPARTGPYGAGHRVICGDLPCMPCFRKRCADPRCMRGITVEMVFTALREGLRERGFLPRGETGSQTRHPGEGENDGNQ